jgi:hypothetical protein
MIYEPNDVITWVETKVQQIPVLFASDKINTDSLPEAFYHYMVAFDEPVLNYEYVAKKVTENFAGTILSLKPLLLDENGIYLLQDDNDLLLNSVRSFSSLHQFIKKHGRSK